MANVGSEAQVIDPETYQVLYGPEIPQFIGRLTITDDKDTYLLTDVYYYDEETGLMKWGTGTIKTVDPLTVPSGNVTHWSNLDPDGFPVDAIKRWQQPREL